MASGTAFRASIRTRVTALICAALLARGDIAWTQQPVSQQPASVQPGTLPAKAEAPKIMSPDQLDSLVAPIALYPDPLLAQVLAAATYPLELVQLQQWLAKNKDLKDKALADAVQKQDWDPSIQSMAALPDVVKQLADNIKWTAELGNAFLAQQSQVMDAVQRMRAKAKDTGKLTSNEQMKVETKVVESKTVVVIEQANPQVVYVPTYNPTVVWGPPVYAYPPVYYPPVGYYAAGMAISFGVGVAMGAMWGGGWGYGCGWGNNDIDINVNNNFNRNTNVNRNSNLSRNNVGSGNNKWSHNAQHRGGAPYSDRATADRFGGTARGDSLSNRQASARQNQGQLGGRQQSGISDRSSAGAGNLGADRRASSNQIGNRQVSAGDHSRGGGAFSGAGRSSGSQARSSSTRGSSSFGGSRGGGGFRGGGGRRR